MQYTVTINIVGSGTPTSTGPSVAGHMWYSLDDGSGNPPASYGFAPVDGAEGIDRAFGPGDVHRNDDTNYQGPRDFNKTIEITKDQYDAMKGFGENPEAAGFSKDYNGITNSCIDFTFGALTAGGLNPKGTDGMVIPTNNIDAVNEALGVSQGLFDRLTDDALGVLGGALDDLISDLFAAASNWLPPRDPLTFDLDGDGLETVGISTTNPILFDHDGDGLKTATGWISPDDGFLVLDRNGNGTIDTGRELFGDSTPRVAGGNAVDGFAALAQEDTNFDGKVDAADANFANLHIWRDLNSDGISQAGELSTLTDLGIASISVAKTENSTLLANGNVIADLGNYTKTDGSLGTIGDTAQLGDVDLAENTFISQFTDSVPIIAEAAALPDMQGSGQVRDLREAASLSASLVTVLSSYAAGTTRDAQIAQLDSLLKAWSDTSAMATTATGAYAGHTLTVNFAGITNGSPEHQAWLDKLTVLERFNGRTFAQVMGAANVGVWEQAA